MTWLPVSWFPAHLAMNCRHNSSTFLRAQGVRRKNFRLDLIVTHFIDNYAMGVRLG